MISEWNDDLSLPILEIKGTLRQSRGEHGDTSGRLLPCKVVFGEDVDVVEYGACGRSVDSETTSDAQNVTKNRREHAMPPCGYKIGLDHPGTIFNQAVAEAHWDAA